MSASNGVWNFGSDIRNQSSRPPDEEVARVAGEQHAAISFEQLLEAGLSKRGVADRNRAGRLFPMFRGTYCVGHQPLSDECWIAAGTLAATDGVASHFSAAYLWEFRALEEREPVHVTSPRKLRSRAEEPATDGRPFILALLTHQATLPVKDWTRRRGIKVTSAERTLLNCAATRPYREARRMVGQALVHRRVSIRSLLDQLDRSPGHRGQKALRRIIATAEPTQSEAEDLVNEMLKSSHLPDFQGNVYVHGVGELDFYDPVWRVGLEFDGRAFHDNPIARADDGAKRRRAAAIGVVIVSLKWSDVTIDRERTLSRIASASP